MASGGSGDIALPGALWVTAPLSLEDFCRRVEAGRGRALLPGLIGELGPALALAAKAPVYAGRMHYLGEDTYAYEPSRTFRPPAEA